MYSVVCLCVSVCQFQVFWLNPFAGPNEVLSPHTLFPPFSTSRGLVFLSEFLFLIVSTCPNFEVTDKGRGVSFTDFATVLSSRVGYTLRYLEGTYNLPTSVPVIIHFSLGIFIFCWLSLHVRGFDEYQVII